VENAAVAAAAAGAADAANPADRAGKLQTRRQHVRARTIVPGIVVDMWWAFVHLPAVVSLTLTTPFTLLLSSYSNSEHECFFFSFFGGAKLII
jgi:hypothetical protein